MELNQKLSDFFARLPGVKAKADNIQATLEELGIKVIAEGIETKEECLTLIDEGVTLFQGYLFARPGFESLPVVPNEIWPLVRNRRAKDRR